MRPRADQPHSQRPAAFGRSGDALAEVLAEIARRDLHEENAAGNPFQVVGEILSTHARVIKLHQADVANHFASGPKGKLGLPAAVDHRRVARVDGYVQGRVVQLAARPGRARRWQIGPIGP